MFQKLLRDLFFSNITQLFTISKRLHRYLLFFLLIYDDSAFLERFCMENFKDCSGRPKENKTFFVATKQKNKRTSVLFCLFISKNELSVILIYRRRLIFKSKAAMKVDYGSGLRILLRYWQ